MTSRQIDGESRAQSRHRPWRADKDCGSTRSSGKPQFDAQNGAQATSSSAMIETADRKSRGA